MLMDRGETESKTASLGFWRGLKLRWDLFNRWLLHRWIRTTVLPGEFDDLGIRPDVPTCFVVDMYAYSSVLILDKVCEERGLARPLRPIRGLERTEPRAWAALRRMRGLIFMRPEPKRSSTVLARLVERACANPDFDMQVVPATVLVGRAPDKEERLFSILFAENWEFAGRLRRLIGTMINGRHTFVQFDEPISLRELASEGLGPSRSVSKISRLLRAHFSQVRAAAIGPDLSHRRTVVDGVLRSPAVHDAIRAKARSDDISTEKAYELAERYAREIAADYNYTFVRVASLALTWIWNRIYDGVKTQHFDRFRDKAGNHELIYVPCHRSHMDYMLLSYILYHNGFMPPHVAAGVNLNLPVVGRFLRMGGAFFLRRSFRSQKLYAAVFNQYLATIQAQGTAIEYFIEGTRSRTGRLLQPRGGMLAMSVRAYLRNPERPIMFQPVYFGYERLVEGSSYIRELAGGQKKAESVSGLVSSLKILRETYGEVHVSFGEPILLDERLMEHDPDWRETVKEAGDRPPWIGELVDRLGIDIMTEINRAADVNPVNLLAVVLLATPRHALDEDDLRHQLELVRRLLLEGPFGDTITVTDRSPDEIIRLGLDMNVLRRREHPLGDVIAIDPTHAVLLTYYRNNATHLVALPSLVACCFANNPEFRRADIERLGRALYGFLRPELFLPWDEDAFPAALARNIDLMMAEGLLSEANREGWLKRAEGGTRAAQQVRRLALSLMQTLERYYIVIAVLSKNGSGTLTRQELERLCTLTAQRISLLNEFDAPEFHDVTLFRQFVGELRATGVVSPDEEGRLCFDQAIEAFASDAKLILSKDIRHAILDVAPQAWEAARELESES